MFLGCDKTQAVPLAAPAEGAALGALVLLTADALVLRLAAGVPVAEADEVRGVEDAVAKLEDAPPAPAAPLPVHLDCGTEAPRAE
jgi:hypothetical protein